MQQDKQGELKIPFEFERQLYFMVKLQGIEQVLKHSEFLHESWVSLCDPEGARGDVDWTTYLQKIIHFATAPDSCGVTFLVQSKNQKNIGAFVLQEDTDSSNKKTIAVYSGFSNEKDAMLPRAAWAFMRQYSKQMGFVEMHAQSRRLSGAAMRFFRQKLGMKPVAMVFSIDL